MNEKDPISYHLFLFPFQWDYVPAGMEKKNIDFETRTRLSVCKEQLENTLWKRNPFIIGDETDTPTDYNEFTFFYDFVRKSIFDYEDRHDSNERLRYFQYNQANKGTYTIHTLSDKQLIISYKLNIINISLHIYNTGVGILTFNLKNNDYTKPDDILRINEYGRRIYPQFLGEHYTTETKRAFLADKIEVNFDDGIQPVFETFEHFDNREKIKNCWFRLPNHITHLFRGTIFTDRDGEKERILISNIMDDRMFTLCWYGNNEKANELKQLVKCDKEYAYACDEWWFCFLFCDIKWASCQNKNLLKKYLLDHTYARWAEYGTYFGVTRETFMLISEDIATLKGRGVPPVYDHLRTNYFQIAVLCLISRASMLRFSGEVSRLSDLANHNKLTEKKFFLPIEKLYENYIEFINKIHFREVTAQVQGIELYNLLYKHMNLKDQITDLDKELEELHRFVNMRREKSRSEDSQRLNWIAAVFLPFTVVSGFLGINFSDTWKFAENFNWITHSQFLIAFSLSSGLSFFTILSILIVKKFSR